MLRSRSTKSCRLRRWSVRALACPASLKGVLSATAAASALAEGLRRAGIDVVELPVADGGEGTLDALHAGLGGTWRLAEVHDAFGHPREARWLELHDGVAAVEAAEAIPLDPERLDPISASSRGLGELVLAVGHPSQLVVGLGGTANVDGGAGLLESVSELPAPTRVACDALVPLRDAARLFAPQKGATPGQVLELEVQLAAMERLQPYAELPGAGAAGGLGAALASLGAELVAGAELVLDAVGFDPSSFDLVVTGEGTVDRTTAEGKAPGRVVGRCAAAGVRCAVFGGRVLQPLSGVENYALSGEPGRAADDLIELGERLGVALLSGP
jgi:glycerate kinase